MWNGGFDRLPHAGQVDVDHVGPVGFARVVERLAAVADTGVGADDVQSPQLLDPAVNRGLDRVVIPYVDLGRDDAPVQLLDQIRSLREVIGGGRRDLGVAADRPADIDGDDVRALFGEPNRVAAALAASRTGDESNLALYPSRHDSPRSRASPAAACASADPTIKN